MELKESLGMTGIIEKIEDFYNEHVLPREEALADRFDDSALSLDNKGLLHPEIWTAKKEIMKLSGEAGLYSLHLPTSVGGGGLDRAEMLLVEEKVYSYGYRLNPAILSWSEGATPRVIWCGEHQREQFTAPLVQGEKTSFHGVTEREAGSNLFDMKTHAVERNGDWILNGTKSYITNAFYSDVAQVLCITDPGKGKKSFSYFQFDTAEYLKKGFRRGKLQQTMWEDGFTGEVHFEDLVLPAEAMIGERGQGFEIAMSSINWTRLRRGGMCSGWSKLLIDATIDRAQNRIINGKPLGSRQGIQWTVSDMYLDWFQARALSLQVANDLNDPGPWWRMPRSQEEIRKISLVKLANDEAFYRVADRALQIHGASGVMKNSKINKLFLIARNLRIPGGSDEVQRTTIAETLGLKDR
jgi:acyl-CoA dehydrogenase